MLKEKIQKIIVAGLLAGTFVSCTGNVFAAQKTITIPALNDGYTKISDTRSGKYSYVWAKCVAVYPKGVYSKDNFEKIRVRIFNTSGKNISGRYTLKEGLSNQEIHLYDNCMNYKKVVFGFCGNSEKYNAQARVGYDAR